MMSVNKLSSRFDIAREKKTHEWITFFKRNIIAYSVFMKTLVFAYDQFIETYFLKMALNLI